MPYVPRIVTEDTYRADVRALMGFDSDELPDSEINNTIHLAPAESEVIREVPDYSTLGTEDMIWLYKAVIAGVARELADACLRKHKVLVRIRDAEERALPIDWKAKKEEYTNEMYRCLGNISTYVGIDKTGLAVGAHEEELDVEYL